MSGKVLGIGLLSIGCLAAAAGGGYLAVRQTQLESTPETALLAAAEKAGQSEALATPPAPVPDAVVGQARRNPDPAPAPASSRKPARPVEKTSAKPEILTASNTPKTSNPGKPAETGSAGPKTNPPGEVAAAPLPQPVETTAATPPLPGSQVATVPPPPEPVDPPRYVPDAPLPAAGTVLESPRLALEEMTVEKHSVIGIRLDSSVSTKTAQVEDRVTATVIRDVTVAGRTAIPAGVRLEGTVALVEHGGKFKNRPRIGLRFDHIVMADGTRVGISTDTIYREGESPTPDATAKVGAGAIAGAILGSVFGGKKGAAIGGAAGGAAGAAVVMKDDGAQTSIPAGAPLTVRLTEDLVINR